MIGTLGGLVTNYIKKLGCRGERSIYSGQDIVGGIREAELSLMEEYGFYFWAPFQVYGIESGQKSINPPGFLVIQKGACIG